MIKRFSFLTTSLGKKLILPNDVVEKENLSLCQGYICVLYNIIILSVQLVDGVGQLLFEVCKGVPKQFHSCTEKLFPLLLRQLGCSLYSPAAVFQTLTKLTQLMAGHTTAEFSSVIWTPLLVWSTLISNMLYSVQCSYM